jgi:hypothetical protein
LGRDFARRFGPFLGFLADFISAARERRPSDHADRSH